MTCKPTRPVQTSTELQEHFHFHRLLELSGLAALELHKLHIVLVIFPLHAASILLFPASAGGLAYTDELVPKAGRPPPFPGSCASQKSLPLLLPSAPSLYHCPRPSIRSPVHSSAFRGAFFSAPLNSQSCPSDLFQIQKWPSLSLA